MPETTFSKQEFDDYLEHFGVKGMHWGVRRNSSGGTDRTAAKAAKSQGKIDKLNAKADEHEKVAAAHAGIALELQNRAADLSTRGTQSEVFKHIYGEKTNELGNTAFYFKTGQTREQAIAQLQNDLRFTSNVHSNAANRHANKAEQLRARAASVKHMDDLDDILEHFGVKGMKWGVRRDGSSGSSHTASPDAMRAQATTDTIHKHGVRAVSNEDLQHLVNRQRLISQHAALTADNVDKGKSVAQGLLKQFGKAVATSVINETVGLGKEVALKKAGIK